LIPPTRGALADNTMFLASIFVRALIVALCCLSASALLG
jgi:hypothetical protein